MARGSTARVAVCLLALGMLLVAGCGGGERAAMPSTGVTGKVTVFAASSLTDVFKAIAVSFQKANPGVTVEFNFGASSALEAQLEQAAPADVFASADAANMQKAIDKKLTEGPASTFAPNLPVLIVPTDNRAGIVTAKDLAKPGTKIVLAGPEVPIGNYARQIIDRLASNPAYGAAFKDAALKNVVSNEANVRAILTKIELGEADAGIVYQTDARVSGTKVKIVAIPAEVNVIAAYPIAVTSGARNAAAARAFIEFVRGAEGRRLLGEAGFDAAP